MIVSDEDMMGAPNKKLRGGIPECGTQTRLRNLQFARPHTDKLPLPAVPPRLNDRAVLRGKLGIEVDIKVQLLNVLIAPETKALGYACDIRFPRKQKGLVARFQLPDFEFCGATINL